MTSKRLILSAFLGAVLLPTGFIGCSGDTDGGKGNDSAAADGQYVSDGAAGGSIRFTKIPKTLEVAETGSFGVEIRDAQGAQVSNVQVVCDSEKGIAIIEPTSGREHTDSFGGMSGVVGGEKPGSYLMECRAEQGFNLAVRSTIKITGDIPAGFDGFPGAAGGNMGGGSSQSSDEVQAVSITFNQNSKDTTTLDSTKGTCTSSGGGSTAETFSNPVFKIKLKNDTLFDLTVASVTVKVVDGNNPVFTKAADVRIEAGKEGTISDTFYTTASGVGVYPGGTNTSNGTFQVFFTIDAETSDGTDRTFTTVTNVTIEDRNNC